MVVKLVISGGEHYGTPDRNSLHLLRNYFTRFPNDAEKVVLSIKGCMKPDYTPDGTPEGVRCSVETCLRVLDGKKKIDLFECSRVDRDVPIETTVQALADLVKEGKIGGISLSEVSANTIRRAAKVHKIWAVEVEVSLFSDHVLSEGIAEACAEYNIPIIAYSPVGRGLLAGQWKSVKDIPQGDSRLMFPRFSPENFDKNLKLVQAVQQIADRKGITSAQLAINWVRQLSQRKGYPVFIPIPGASTESRVVENSKVIDLTQEELSEIDGILASFETAGARYPERFMDELNG
ncbi:hypothetical protein RBB50_006191 [Rhinocladiella similis]